ncbi:MAG: MBL fold metallo-hydrolase [Clostridia bacterium]|nr:MBL fold metallo-hydrolase [Clostridia bacterium]
METYNLENFILSKKENASSHEFDAKVTEYKEKGFSVAFENGCFKVLTNGEETVNISLKGKKSTLRIISEKGVNVPPSATPVEEKCDTLLTQMKTIFFSCDNGMCYIIRLADGSFVIIDGGVGTFDEPEHFLEILNAQKMGDGVPLIRAWFITHPHRDHFGLFEVLMETHRGDFLLDTLIYNWPDKDYAQHRGNTTRFDEIAEKHEGFSVITGRTGYTFTYGENVFEILFSPDDILPKKLGNVNDTSLVIRHTYKDKTILYLSDVMTPSAEIILEECREKTLRADILQVAHHGFWGASDDLYRVIRPKTLLWPIPDYHYFNMSQLPQNDYLVNSGEIETVYFSSLGDVTLNLSSSHVSKHYENPLPYVADFSKKSMMKLGWNCIHKGYSVFRAPKGEFTENGIRITTPDDAPSIVEILKPPQIAGLKRLSVHIEGEIEKASKFGFIYNYKNPKEIDESATVPLSVEKGPFSYILQMDAESKTLAVLKNGLEAFTAPYTPDERHGIAFLLSEAVIHITSLSVK